MKVGLIRIFFFAAITFIFPIIAKAQKIFSYSLGTGYHEFVNSTKVEAIQLKINGSEMNLSEIYEQQLNDPNSLITQLTNRGAFAWGEYTYYIDNLQKRLKDKVLWIPQSNSLIVSVIPPDNAIDAETWYREANYSYKCLELYSDLVKTKNNIAYDERQDQDSLNLKYELITDEIVAVEKSEKVKQLDGMIKDINLLIDKWNKLLKEKNASNVNMSYNFLDAEILKLKEQMQKEIKQLPVENFINNKAKIIIKYNDLIKGRQIAFSQKIKEQKIKDVQEQKFIIEEMNKLGSGITDGKIKAEELKLKISQIKELRMSEFPIKPILDRTKYIRLIEIATNKYNEAFDKIIY